MKSESQSTEFKPSLSQLHDIVESVSAFSNTSGGKIVIGMDDDGNVLGVDVGKRTLENLANQIKQNTDPPVLPSIHIEDEKGKNIIVVEVPESSVKPVLAYGRAFKRVGRSNHKMGYEEIRRMTMQSSKIYWDGRICEGAALDDIDREKIRWFVGVAKNQRGLNIAENASAEEALAKLKLLKDGKLTNAAALLFSKEPEFLQSEVKCIRFSGNEPLKPYIDFQTLSGNAFDLIDRAEDFVLRNIKKAIWLVPGQVQREEKYEYPPDAIREAIANAVVHRDYESPSKVQVRVFDNRIEVWSPGLLPEGITIEDLKKEHRSIPRNPLLFKQLFWVKYVEDVGGGTVDMINWCRQEGLPEPEFTFISGAFVVVFKLPPAIEDLEKLGLNERQRKAIEHIVKSGSISNGEYQKISEVSRETATRDLKGLVEKGILRKTGKGKRDIRYELLLRQDDAKMTQKMTQKNNS